VARAGRTIEWSECFRSTWSVDGFYEGRRAEIDAADMRENADDRNNDGAKAIRRPDLQMCGPICALDKVVHGTLAAVFNIRMGEVRNFQAKGAFTRP
jgi:hypothetical protein